MPDRRAAPVALCFIAVSVACVGGRSESSVVVPRQEPASVAAPNSPARLARAQPELGEVAQELSDSLWIVFQDSRNRRWFGSDGQGAFRFDGKTLVRYSTKDGLPNDHIRGIQEDGSGNLFFYTSGGISKFDGQRFHTLVPTDPKAPASAWKSEPGDLWFAGGPYRYDGTYLYRLEFPKIPLEDEFRSKFPGVRYSPYEVYTIHRDRKGSLWFGTSTFGVCRFDGTSFDWITEDELTELEAGPSFGVRGIVEDKNGKFWLSNLLHRYDGHPDGGAANATNAPWYTKWRGIVEIGEKGDVGNAYFMSGLTDRHGVSWIATYGAGVWRIDGERLTHYPVLDGGQPITLFSIYEDRGGVLWLGTQSSGAWRFNGKTFERFKP